MPATFQKTIDVALKNCHSKFAFLDDILVITKGNLTDHEKVIDKILYLFDKENLATRIQICEFARKKITVVRISNYINWYHPNQKEMRVNKQIRDSN